MNWRGELILCLMFVLAVFISGWWCGQRAVKVETIVHVDTVFYQKPQEFCASDIPLNVRVPRIIFAEYKDNKLSLPDSIKADSVDIIVSERILEYQDSTYYARIVGPVIGPMAPRLDFIQTYNTTTVKTVHKKPRIAVTLGPNLSVTPHGLDVGIGAQVGFVIWAK